MKISKITRPNTYLMHSFSNVITLQGNNFPKRSSLTLEASDLLLKCMFLPFSDIKEGFMT